MTQQQAAENFYTNSTETPSTYFLLLRIFSALINSARLLLVYQDETLSLHWITVGKPDAVNISWSSTKYFMEL